MKKLLATVVMLSIVILSSGCSPLPDGVSVDFEDKIVTVRLDGFSGRYSFKMDKENEGDGTVYYAAELNEGELTGYTKDSWIFDKIRYFSIKAEDGACSGAAYVDSSVVALTIIIETDKTTSGVLYFTLDKEVGESLIE